MRLFNNWNTVIGVKDSYVLWLRHLQEVEADHWSWPFLHGSLSLFATVPSLDIEPIPCGTADRSEWHSHTLLYTHAFLAVCFSGSSSIWEALFCFHQKDLVRAIRSQGCNTNRWEHCQEKLVVSFGTGKRIPVGMLECSRPLGHRFPRYLRLVFSLG